MKAFFLIVAALVGLVYSVLAVNNWYNGAFHIPGTNAADHEVIFATREIEKNPRNSAAFARRACRYNKLELYERALNDCNQYIALQKGTISPDVLRDRARALRGLDRYQEAAVVYEKIISTSPEHQDYYYSAYSLSEIGKYDEATRRVNLALKQKPSCVNCLLERAFCYSNTNNLDLALEDCNAAIKASSCSRCGDSCEPCARRGSVYLKKKEYELALKDSQVALEKGDDRAWVYLDCAKALNALGRKQEALSFCSESIKRDPKSKAAQRLLAELQGGKT